MKQFVFLFGVFFLFACSDQKTTQPESIGNREPDTARVFYPDGGGLKTIGLISNGEKHGEWKSFYPDGTPWSITTFRDGKKDGPTRTFYEDGLPRYEGTHTNDKPSGTWTFYDETGAVVKTVDYSK